MSPYNPASQTLTFAVLVPHKEPGDEVTEGVGFVWEGSNTAATDFFAKMFGQGRMTVEGTLDAIDMRPGREGNVVSWAGGLAENPRVDNGMGK